MFYYVTSRGVNIAVAQVLFAALYLVNLAAVMTAYSRVARVRTCSTHLRCAACHCYPPFAHTYADDTHTHTLYSAPQSLRLPPYLLLFLTCTAYRVHSIFVLRMFNDPVAMLLLHCSLLCLLYRVWWANAALFRSVYMYTLR